MMNYKFDGLGIELTRRCNKACAHCMRGAAQNLTMPNETINKIVSNVADVQGIALFGGESLLDIDRVEYLIQKILSSNWTTKNIEVTTNGTICDKRIIDAFEAFCCGYNGRNAYIFISDDRFHNPDEYNSAFAFYKPLVDEANQRIRQICEDSEMHVTLSSVHKGRGIEYILYSGNAEDLIDGRNEQYRLEEESVRYTNTWKHRIKILGDTIPCCIEFLANGNVILHEELSYDAMDRNSLGNIMTDSLTDIINRHNEECLLLCSEIEGIYCGQNCSRSNSSTQFSDYLRVCHLFRMQILKLRYKAKRLFPHVPAAAIIMSLPFPTKDEIDSLMGEIFVIHLNRKPSDNFDIAAWQLTHSVHTYLTDKTKRRYPYKWFGDESDILNSTAFCELRKLEDLFSSGQVDAANDLSINFHCRPENLLTLDVDYHPE